ncbi:hypothetical protein [Streptomyces sp. NBC_01334]|uniref:hypothetical protein n=1 Tax=Streptomyces sp. NBC_01334 TaxID=2903827 RepID=UPI002E1558E6|nr:hypothetical protein OG736_46840 [Streptomyces sp. NBC_01334]
MALTADEAFQRYQNERERIEVAARGTADHIARSAARKGLTCEVTSRAKEVSSFKNKIERKGYTDPWRQITDKAGVRVIVQHSGLLDPILEVITGCLDIVEIQDHRKAADNVDRLSYPRLHIQAVMAGQETDPDGTPYECEIQLRTEAVDLWARMSHKLLYKPGVAPPADVSRSLYRLVALIELYDLEVERGVQAMSAHPELARSNQLLDVTEQVYRTFTDHPYSRDLSHEVVDVLTQAIDDETDYSEKLTRFAEDFRERLERAYADYGPTSAHFLAHGRYLLASQPESLIIFERLTNARFRLQTTWEEGELSETMLTDMASAWGTAL